MLISFFRHANAFRYDPSISRCEVGRIPFDYGPASVGPALFDEPDAIYTVQDCLGDGTVYVVHEPTNVYFQDTHKFFLCNSAGESFQILNDCFICFHGKPFRISPRRM